MLRDKITVPVATASAIASGDLYLWGAGDGYGLGFGTTANKTVPTHLGTAKWLNVAVSQSGRTFSSSAYTTTQYGLAIKSDGTLWGWGANANGQLGDGTTTQRTSPVQIGSAIWVDISVSSSNSMGIKTDGTLWGWGLNNDKGV